jgi:hypothetical protein
MSKRVNKVSSQILNWRWSLARLVWLTLLFAHAFWFARSLTNADALMATRASLFASIVFFFLKTVDARYLRVRWTRRSAISACLIVLLLHGGAIHRSMDEPLADFTPDGFWLLLPVALFTPVLGRLLCFGLYRWIAGRLARLAATVRSVKLHLYELLYACVRFALLDRRVFAPAPPRAPTRRHSFA